MALRARFQIPSSPFSVRLLTCAEVANRLDVERQKVERWLRLGVIPSFAIDAELRISERDFFKFAATYHLMREEFELKLENAPPIGIRVTSSELLSVRAAANFLGVGRTTLYALISSKQISSVKIGRRRLIERDTLERLVSKNKA